MQHDARWSLLMRKIALMQIHRCCDAAHVREPLMLGAHGGREQRGVVPRRRWWTWIRAAADGVRLGVEG